MSLALNDLVNSYDALTFGIWIAEQPGDTYLSWGESTVNPDSHLLIKALDAETEELVSSFELKIDGSPSEWLDGIYKLEEENQDEDSIIEDEKLETRASRCGQYCSLSSGCRSAINNVCPNCSAVSQGDWRKRCTIFWLNR
ncbi:BA75_01858T0 [Komagataella pastoris]|uniref:BA75_01858T0 n=1 Tax=Komagataella pastoris TaxID=4922 RepID=A0A1B2J5V5_PICPA|nr:BA75_01858T0 [Komagataella pastoris]